MGGLRSGNRMREAIPARSRRLECSGGSDGFARQPERAATAGRGGRPPQVHLRVGSDTSLLVRRTAPRNRTSCSTLISATADNVAHGERQHSGALFDRHPLLRRPFRHNDFTESMQLHAMPLRLSRDPLHGAQVPDMRTGCFLTIC